MEFLNRLRPSRFYKYIDEVSRRNVIASKTFLTVGFVVSVVNMLSNVFIKETNGFIGGFVMLLYFGVATIVCRYVIKENIHRSLLFLYIIQIPVMLFGILMVGS